jgi:hypothetical protein
MGRVVVGTGAAFDGCDVTLSDRRAVTFRCVAHRGNRFPRECIVHER